MTCTQIKRLITLGDGTYSIMSLKNKANIYKPKEVNIVKLKEYLKKKENEATISGNNTLRR